MVASVTKFNTCNNAMLQWPYSFILCISKVAAGKYSMPKGIAISFHCLERNLCNWQREILTEILMRHLTFRVTR